MAIVTIWSVMVCSCGNVIGHTCEQQPTPPPFYGHYAGQPVLADNSC